MQDKLFRETLQYLKKHENSDNLYFLIEPHLLYLSEEQSDSYLKIMKNPSYSGTFHSTTVGLIEEHLEDIFKNEKGSISLVDLGPGYPDKAIPIGKYFKSLGFNIHYMPVDISSSFLNLSISAMKPYVVKATSFHSKFEHCTISAESLLYPPYILMGVTFMNFNPNFILPLLKNMVKKPCKILFSAEIITENNSIAHILSSYMIPEHKKFAFSPLRNLGFEESDVEFTVAFKNSRVEATFTVLFNSKYHDVPIKKGDVVITAISYRYTLEEFKNIMANYFTNHNIFFSTNKSTALVLAYSDDAVNQSSLLQLLEKRDVCHSE